MFKIGIDLSQDEIKIEGTSWLQNINWKVQMLVYPAYTQKDMDIFSWADTNHQI